MVLSPLAKKGNSPETYAMLKKWVDAHNELDEKTMTMLFDPKDIEKAIQSTIDTAMKKICK
jgi:hypothetical protein